MRSAGPCCPAAPKISNCTVPAHAATPVRRSKASHDLYLCLIGPSQSEWMRRCTGYSKQTEGPTNTFAESCWPPTGRPERVGHVNSLRGACLVQGIQVLRLAHGMWPQAAITEAHPKALLLASEAAARVAAGFADRVGTEHERDAVLAAYSGFALTVQQAGWLDLVRLDPDPYFPSGCCAAYWFPENRLSG